MTKERAKNSQKTLIVKNIADKHKVTPAFVYMVLDGARNNEDILADYMELDEQLNTVFRNAMLSAVTKLVPFEKSTN